MATAIPPKSQSSSSTAKAKRRRKPLTRLEKLQRSDGALCVTFVNTGSAKRKSLATYDDLLIWGGENRVLADADSKRLAGVAAEHPAKAAAVVRRAETLRARLERILLALAAGEKLAADDFKLFHAELRRVMATRELVATSGGGYRWTWGGNDGDDLDRMLWPVLLSASTVLTSRDRERVGRCDREDCDLLFVGHGGGRRRKFCGGVCRTRSSSRAYYRREVKPRRAAAKKSG